MKLADRQPVSPKTTETETQARIRKLREQLNSQNQEDSRPFTSYKIITYLCTLFFPLVPFALYRIWCPRTEFSPREQLVWTGVIAVIALYAVSMSL